MTTPSRESLSRFITTEAISPEYQDSYQKVWDAVRSAFNSPRPDSVGYWRYPLFLQVGNQRKEPDILIVDREWGIITIEVCTATIDQISWIENNNIDFCNEQLTYNYSFKNISKYVRVLRKYCDQEPVKNEESNINNKVIGKSLIAFPYISTEQWQEKGWQGIEEESPFIFNNQLGEVGFKNRIEKAHHTIEGESLNEEQYKSLLSVISGTSILRKQLPNVESHEGKTRYNILAEAQKLMYDWDVKQEWISKSVPPGPQRVRGIAGSGKTVLFSQKAVITHLKHPDWKVAFVFFTRSLYDQIEELFKLWIERFTDGEQKFSNNRNSNLRVLHAWGAKGRDGLYGELCQELNIRKLLPKDTRQGNPNRGLAYGCRDFLKQKSQFNPLFDALIIDEGQDLVIGKDKNNDDLTFIVDGEKKQSIYWLAYQSLKPVSENDLIQKRLIWAYDEAQTIHSAGAVAPKAEVIFGKKLGQMLGGKSGGIYKGDIRKAYDMERCYRTPGDILTIAYALGTGLLREGDIIHPGPMRKKDLQAIGFEVLQGNFKNTTKPITITRPKVNSPNHVSDLCHDSVIEFNTYASREEEFLALSDKIKLNLEQDQLQPSRNILVIALGYTTPPSYTGNNLESEIAQFFRENGINIYYIPSALEINQLNPKYPHNNPDQFWHDGAITVSRIDRTKGNEADMVYVVGLDNIAKNESDPKLRNQLFVALTRSRGWVHLSGIGDYPFYEEVRKVMEQKDTFTFTIKGVTPPEDANDDFTEEDESSL